MRILVAPDKFKDALGGAEVTGLIAAGLRESLPNTEIVTLAVADGGEGTASVICAATGGEWHACETHDPLGNRIHSRYCTIAHGRTAVMEMSEASGLWRVPPELRDPIAANSFGAGEMLLHAARRGVNEIIIGLGGSATNDGGFGMARALGFRFLDENDAELNGEISGLLRLARIEPPDDLLLPSIVAAADVRNPLLGPKGATRVFAPQKGASAAQCDLLEHALQRFADVVAEELATDFRDELGAGAAGGLGFGLLSFCGASIRAGFEVVAERIGLKAAVREADVVITGEGRLDAQTLAGKAAAGVARLAREYRRRVYAVVGDAEETPELREMFDGIVILKPAEMSVAEAIDDTPRLLREGAHRLAMLLDDVASR